ncbi:hypothetical protein Cyrtocomes_00834 [Candidatus Cyrtobacter comes]|uniref:Uncharacterized protein n=1 Tax=Candidatus Cyrtobacter comes TaxID=675776 RepID=A0ABU5L8K2_9RICK|nr:hypothetical protein [Candidatus Cyrtobacter comes]MDZ5762451.1 hypothetical protein [Candidatus Cyrtobacter comes]
MPKVVYEHVDRQTSKTYTSDLVLRYKFDGDIIRDVSIPNINAPQCAKFSNFSTTYCAVVPKDDVEKICVCAQADCNSNKFIGCVPRPMPKDSNVAMIGEFTSKEDYKGREIPALKISLVRTLTDGSIIKKDADGAKVVEKSGTYYKLDGNNDITNTPAKEPVIVERFQLPKERDAIAAEYYEFISQDASGNQIEGLMRGTVSAYGFNFNVSIPKLNSSNKIEDIGVITPIQNQTLKGCFVFSSSDEKGVPRYFIPKGKRDRKTCCPSYVKNKEKECIVPPIKKKCDDGSMAMNDENAQRAFCPGVYEEPENPDVADDICLTCENKNVMPDPFCLKMPTDCGKQEIPNSFNGFAIWDKSSPGKISYSTCSIDYGLQASNEISIRKKDTSSLPLVEQGKIESEHNKLINYLADLKDESKKIHKRISTTELPKIDPKYQQYFDIQDTEKVPERICTANLYSRFNNPCLITNDGCVELKKPLELTGNMLLNESGGLYYNVAVAELGSLKPGQEREMAHIADVNGKCPAGYTAEGSLTRKCVTRYIISKASNGKGKIDVKSQFWGDVNGRCSKIK